MTDDHDHVPGDTEDSGPSNPIVAGLPIGIWIPMIISIVVIAIVVAKFVG